MAETEGKRKEESIKVLVRVRPLSDAESGEEDGVIDIQDGTSLSVLDGKKSFQCAYDAVLGFNSNQADVYATVRECTSSVLDGFNSTIFAYGQTGSGKVKLDLLIAANDKNIDIPMCIQTFSMYGPPTETGSRMPSDHQLLGVIPRAINEIFELALNQKCLQLSVYCSFVQIYNENLFDMLRSVGHMLSHFSLLV